MYSKPKTGSSYRAKPSFGSYNASAPRRTGGSSTFRGASFPERRARVTGGNKRRSFRGDNINENLYINKATKKDEAPYIAKHVFNDFGIHELLAKNLEQKGFIAPSPIQDQAIPPALEGKDVIGIAATGTGKTAAFLIPLINKLIADRKHKIMILAPTRELAQQIEAEFRLFTHGMRLHSVSCVGGAPIGKQMRELELGVHVVIGTPGRVQDLITRHKIDTKLFGSIVLDEVDRMLDMGFIDDMRSILGGMPKEKQGLFFSATLSPEIKKLCHDFLRDPIVISVKTRDTASSVEQDVVRVRDSKKKIDMLHDILIKPEASKVLIFREMKRSVDELAKELKARGFTALALHGDMRNRERERAVKALATGEAHIVIATDVAARGIDIPDITHVINYDVPSTYDAYIHRIGRTGRGNKTGHALTFVNSR